MSRVLGISASLRNARFGLKQDSLAHDVVGIMNQHDLMLYLASHTQINSKDFIQAGKAEGLPFEDIYGRLKKFGKKRGLSNSEAALAAALWAAHREGSEIQQLSLARYFPISGAPRHLEELRNAILSADGLIISGPVYFGDRGSLAQSLIEFISADPILRRACKGKVYAGLAVGAKRNGGQETTLIYQMLDMINLDFLAVGNSSETTAQYGGTAVAGDIGQLYLDEYGIETCLGTGQRVARVSQLLSQSKTSSAGLKDKLKIQLWLLQDDRARTGLGHFKTWAQGLMDGRHDLDVQLYDAVREEVVRCIACDICPTHIGAKEEYRCIITSPADFFVNYHQALVQADGILLCAYSPKNRSSAISVYQQFMERTRYLRRDNYAFSDVVIAPFVISELFARQNLHLRMLTSGVRHHTVLHHPIIGMINDGVLLGSDSLLKYGADFAEAAMQVTVGRYLVGHRDDLVYRPIGYEVGTEKSNDDAISGKTKEALSKISRSVDVAAEKRLERAKLAPGGF